MTFDQLLNADYRFPTVGLFKQPRCPACEALLPRLELWCKDHSVRLEIFMVSENVEAAKKLGLRTAPTVVVVHEGEAKIAFAGNPVGSLEPWLRAVGVKQ
jgi:thioredoxin-like negative regulator of GroEL